MIPRRVTFWSDQQEVSAAERDLLSQFRHEIEAAILKHGSGDAETQPMKGGGVAFLTTIPKPIIGRIMASWVFLDDENAFVTGVRTGEAYETPVDED